MPDLHTLGHELEKAFKAMRKKRLPQAPYVSQHRDRFLKPAATEDWKSLARAASKQREKARESLKRLASLELSFGVAQPGNSLCRNGAAGLGAAAKLRQD